MADQTHSWQNGSAKLMSATSKAKRKPQVGKRHNPQTSEVDLV